MYTNNDILFPYHVIPSLKHLQGPEWRALIERIMTLPETHEETIALMLLMVRLNGCMACETDSYRAMRGCPACAQQTLRRFKGEESELIDLFKRALQDVRAFALKHDEVDILMFTPQ